MSWIPESVKKLEEKIMTTTRFTLICACALVLAASNASAQQMRHGSIETVDEPNGSITIQQTPDGTVGTTGSMRSDKLTVQDGLLFNAIKAGDKVTYSAQEINGINTITKLQKE